MSFLKDRVTSVDQARLMIGQEIFAVCGKMIDRYRITRIEELGADRSPFVYGDKYVGDNPHYMEGSFWRDSIQDGWLMDRDYDRFSSKDYNLERNHYNGHAAFTSREAAEAYVAFISEFGPANTQGASFEDGVLQTMRYQRGERNRKENSGIPVNEIFDITPGDVLAAALKAAGKGQHWNEDLVPRFGAMGLTAKMENEWDLDGLSFGDHKALLKNYFKEFPLQKFFKKNPFKDLTAEREEHAQAVHEGNVDFVARALGPRSDGDWLTPRMGTLGYNGDREEGIDTTGW